MHLAHTALQQPSWRLVNLVGSLLFALCQGFISTAGGATEQVSFNEIAVTTTEDAGEGSLRQAILMANISDGPDVIRFDSIGGPFATPQTITLKEALPDLVGEVTIDGYIEDRLWSPNGVTVSGGNVHRVFGVGPNAEVSLRSFTVADGSAERGGGVANRDKLVVKGVTFLGNSAGRDGGALANATEEADVITFDPRVFSAPRTIVPKRPLPKVTADVTIDAQDTGGVMVRGEFGVLHKVADTELDLKGITFENGQQTVR